MFFSFVFFLNFVLEVFVLYSYKLVPDVSWGHLRQIWKIPLGHHNILTNREISINIWSHENREIILKKIVTGHFNHKNKLKQNYTLHEKTELTTQNIKDEGGSCSIKMFILFTSQTEYFSKIKNSVNVWIEFQFGQSYQSHRLIFSCTNLKNVKLCFVHRGSGTKGKNKIMSN